MQGDLSLTGQVFFNDAVAATAVAVKGSFGFITALKYNNTTAAVAYLQIFFKPSASVTVGTTVPDLSIRMAANESSAWIVLPSGLGTTAGTGITLAGTTTAGGAVAAALSVILTFL